MWDYHRPYLNNQDRIDNDAKQKNNIHTTHHVIPVSIGGTNEKNNKINLTEDFHRSFHRIFWNGWPREQLEQLLRIDERVLTSIIKNALIDILDKDSTERYKQWSIFIRNKL